LHAAEYAIKIAKDENAQIICIHVISTTTLEYAPPEYSKDIKKKVESWFNTIKDIAKTLSISEVKTEILMDVHSVVGSIADYATTENIDLIVIGTKGLKTNHLTI
jgi:nucleotide-binding universal stress UspA family protein